MSHRPFPYKNGVQIVQMASVKAIEARKRAIEQELLACESELGLHAGDKTKLGTLVEGDTVLGSDLADKSAEIEEEIQQALRAMPTEEISGTRVAELRKEIAARRATRSVAIGGKMVTVTFENPAHLEHWEQILAMKAFKDYCRDFDHTLNIEGITIKGLDLWGPRVGLLMMHAKVTKKNGSVIPGTVFMRGNSVAMLPVITCLEDQKKYTALVVQTRIPYGKRGCHEIPAGMMDQSNNFKASASKELEEELGLTVDASQLINLTEWAYNGKFHGMYPSIGGCDEQIAIMLYRTTMTREKLNEIHDKQTGVAEEGEVIRTKIIPLDELIYTVPDAKAMCAYLLYKEYEKFEGMKQRFKNVVAHMKASDVLNSR
jgi:ADP-sugar diphosphatase